jgi:hypothetical protein
MRKFLEEGSGVTFATGGGMPNPHDDLMLTIVRAMLPHDPRGCGSYIAESIMVDLEDKDIGFLAALAAIAEIAIDADPFKYPLMWVNEDVDS